MPAQSVSSMTTDTVAIRRAREHRSDSAPLRDGGLTIAPTRGGGEGKAYMGRGGRGQMGHSLKGRGGVL